MEPSVTIRSASSLPPFIIDEDATPSANAAHDLFVIATLFKGIAANLASSMTATTPIPTKDNILTAKEAAMRMNVTVRWLYKNKKTLPFATKISHKNLGFFERGMERWLKNRSTV